MSELILEFGVYRGHSLRQLAKRFPDDIVYGFDSFCGLTERWYIYEAGDMAVDAPKNLPSNTKLMQGLIEDTLPDFLSQRKSEPVKFVHIDVDTYKTALFILNQLRPHLRDGSIFVFDEYWGHTEENSHEMKAVKEFLDNNSGVTFNQMEDMQHIDRSLSSFSARDYLRVLSRPWRWFRLVRDRLRQPDGTSQAFAVTLESPTAPQDMK